MERKVPSVLWIGIAALSIMTLMQLLVGVQKGSDSLFVAAVLDAVLLAGLLLGYKWAYIVTLVTVIPGSIVMLSRNPEHAIPAVFLNGLVLVPVILSTRFFFPRPPDHPDAEKPGME